MKTAYFQLIFTTALAGLVLAAASQATTIYTWEDEQGGGHFSDQPHPGASTLELNTQPATELPADAMTPSPGPDTTDSAKAKTAPLPPATIRLLSPHHQQTIRDNEGIIPVSVVTNRQLNQGHTVQLLLDGARYGRPQTQQEWRLVNIDRGSHTLQAQVLKYGKVIALSDIITVYLHRASRFRHKPPAVKPE